MVTMKQANSFPFAVVRASASAWNICRSMNSAVSKACNYCFHFKQQNLVQIICSVSLGFYPSKQQVNGCYQDCLEEIRERERRAKPDLYKELFPEKHLSFTPEQQSQWRPADPKPTTVRTEKNRGAIYCLWGAAPGTQAFS